MNAIQYMLDRLAVAGNSTMFSPCASIQSAFLAWHEDRTIKGILDALCGHDHRLSGRADRRNRLMRDHAAFQEP